MSWICMYAFLHWITGHIEEYFHLLEYDCVFVIDYVSLFRFIWLIRYSFLKLFLRYKYKVYNLFFKYNKSIILNYPLRSIRKLWNPFVNCSHPTIYIIYINQASTSEGTDQSANNLVLNLNYSISRWPGCVLVFFCTYIYCTLVLFVPYFSLQDYMVIKTWWGN